MEVPRQARGPTCDRKARLLMRDHVLIAIETCIAVVVVHGFLMMMMLVATYTSLAGTFGTVLLLLG